MKGCASISIVFSVMLATVDWVSASNWKSTATLAAEVTANTCIRVGRLNSVQGQVHLKREGWSDFHPTTVGAELCLGDQLRPAPGARVIVQCADTNQTLWTVRDGVTSGAANGCSKPAEPRNTPFGPIPPTRGETIANSRIPYIISPRRTRLLNAQEITLRWNGVGAKSYTVRVRGEGEDYCQAEVSGTSVVCAGQPLKPGVYYTLIVETDTNQDSREEDAESGFLILDDNERSLVQAARDQLVNQKLDEEALALSLTDLYIRHDLKAEAISTLEALVKKGSKTAAVYRLLGELYWQAGLPSLAESPYLKAVELAAADDMEGQAEAAARLGEVYAVLGKINKTIQYINLALPKYEALKNSKRVSELKNQLVELTNQKER